MLRIVIRETAIFMLLLVTLALLMHPDLFGNPGQRIALMQERDVYTHPLLYTALIYIILLLLRLIVRAVRRLFRHLPRPQ
jgi:hypothetical protein